MADESNDRLTLLERAQLLHDATLRRHGEMLDWQDEQLARLRGRLAQQRRTHAELLELAARLEALMADVCRERHHCRELTRSNDPATVARIRYGTVTEP